MFVCLCVCITCPGVHVRYFCPTEDEVCPIGECHGREAPGGLRSIVRNVRKKTKKTKERMKTRKAKKTKKTMMVTMTSKMGADSKA